MILDDGICTIYDAEQDPSTDLPKYLLTQKTQSWYKELSFYVSEYYASLQSNAQIEKRVRIIQNKAISSQDVVRLKTDGPVYKIGRFYHDADEAGNLITDLTLERTDQVYDDDTV